MNLSELRSNARYTTFASMLVIEWIEECPDEFELDREGNLWNVRWEQQTGCYGDDIYICRNNIGAADRWSTPTEEELRTLNPFTDHDDEEREPQE